MAENEVKTEKKSASMSIWFIIFLVYLIGSLTYIFMLKGDYKALESLKQQEINELKTSNHELTADLYKLDSNLDTIYDLLSETRIDLESILASNKEEEKQPVEVSLGAYTGTTEVLSGDAVATTMTLTLAENNEATLVENETTLEGLFVLSENAVIFKSNDGLATYSFEVLEDGNLKLVDENVELTLSK